MRRSRSKSSEQLAWKKPPPSAWPPYTKKDRAIVQLHAELAARDAALTEQRQQTTALQQTVAEERERGHYLESESGALHQRVRKFEEESGLDFLKRQFKRRSVERR